MAGGEEANLDASFFSAWILGRILRFGEGNIPLACLDKTLYSREVVSGFLDVFNSPNRSKCAFCVGAKVIRSDRVILCNEMNR